MKTISSQYTLAYLSRHPQTHKIVHEHLRTMTDSYDINLETVHASPQDMFENNMGGGISFEMITSMIQELNEIRFPLDECN